MIEAFGFEWHQVSTDIHSLLISHFVLYRHLEKPKPSLHTLTVLKLLTPSSRMTLTTFSSAQLWLCESKLAGVSFYLSLITQIVPAQI